MSDGTHGGGDRELVFYPVWRVLRKYRANVNPKAFFAVGELVVTGAGISFRSTDYAGNRWLPDLLTGPADHANDITVRNVTRVHRRRYSSALPPRFVAIDFESDDGPRTAYFNDGGWMGWRPLLTGSNRHIARVISERLQLGSG